MERPSRAVEDKRDRAGCRHHPPFSQAEAFLRRALGPFKGKVAMLSPIAFDAANGRWDLFDGPPGYGDPPNDKRPVQ